MIALFGQMSLWLALCFALLQSLLPLYGHFAHRPLFLAVARPSVLGQCFFITLAYVLLLFAFAYNDFTLTYVAANSHPSLPLFYRLTAIWGAHEGSILLWVWILAIWSIVFAITQKNNAILPLVLAFLGLISIGFLSFLLFTSNPFLSSTVPLQGQDLNPLLQDPGFVIHPPMLYAGYVGFSAAFAITLAALLSQQLTNEWARITKQFALAAFCFLTLGITLGSWWAYRVLGWGGFWFWDPVENASLLPWLSGLAFIHVLILVEKRGIAKAWAAFLAIICFNLSLLGTFLVRSGVLISAHTFANDPSRGVFLLLLLAVILTASLIIYLFTLNKSKPLSHKKMNLAWASQEMGLLLNSALFFIVMLTVLLGTLYPLIFDALQLGSISVGAPYFNKVLMPFLFIIIACMAYWGRRLQWGMSLAHFGFVLLAMGILLSSTMSKEREVRLTPGNAVHLGPYQFFFVATKEITGPNYRGIQAVFEVFKNKRPITYLYPEKRIYPVRDMVMTKVSIHPGLFRDLYIALGEPLNENDWSVRIYYKPFIRFIWLGGLFIIAGGLIAILKRKRKNVISE